MKKAVLAILIAGMAVLTACSNNKTVKNDDNVYKYSDYEYKVLIMNIKMRLNFI